MTKTQTKPVLVLDVEEIEHHPEWLKRISPTATAFATMINPDEGYFGSDGVLGRTGGRYQEPQDLQGERVRVIGRMWEVVSVETFAVFRPYPTGMRFGLMLREIKSEDGPQDSRHVDLKVMVADRAGGKTMSAIDWVRAGQKVPDSYPGWSRVLVLPNRQQWRWVRAEAYRSIEDFDHRVFEYTEWANARGANDETEVLIDNLDMVLPTIPGRLAAITLSGEQWLPPVLLPSRETT